MQKELSLALQLPNGFADVKAGPLLLQTCAAASKSAIFSSNSSTGATTVNQPCKFIVQVQLEQCKLRLEPELSCHLRQFYTT